MEKYEEGLIERIEGSKAQFDALKTTLDALREQIGSLSNQEEQIEEQLIALRANILSKLEEYKILTGNDYQFSKKEAKID